MPHIFLPCGTSSPLSSRWGIVEWPTIFVLDDQGTIRYRGNEDVLGEKGLEEAVRTLLEEREQRRTR